MGIRERRQDILNDLHAAVTPQRTVFERFRQRDPGAVRVDERPPFGSEERHDVGVVELADYFRLTPEALFEHGIKALQALDDHETVTPAGEFDAHRTLICKDAHGCKHRFQC